MKALSIKQPWAWLICAGIKDIENRDWFIGRKPALGGYFKDRVIELPQRIYVHAGKIPEKYSEELIKYLCARGLSVIQTLMLYSGQIARGAIIGEVTITECVTKSDSRWFVGKYGFVLKDPMLYDKPIPYRGQLGFFKVSLPQPLSEQGVK